MPGMKKLKDFGDTGTPRLPDGRPVPKILLTLMRLMPSQGITARSDKVAVNFGKGLPDDETRLPLCPDPEDPDRLTPRHCA